MEGMRSFVRERIGLHAVDGKKSDSSFFDIGAERPDHALTILLMLVSHAGRESENGHAVISVNVDAHLTAETV